MAYQFGGPRSFDFEEINDGEYNDSYNNKAIKEFIEVFYYKKHNTVFKEL